jgi:hypothetical protein
MVEAHQLTVFLDVFSGTLNSFDNADTTSGLVYLPDKSISSTNTILPPGFCGLRCAFSNPRLEIFDLVGG